MEKNMTRHHHNNHHHHHRDRDGDTSNLTVANTIVDF
jgi:hypothetical protein